MQEKSGLITISNGSSTVQGDANVRWDLLCKRDGSGNVTTEPVSLMMFMVVGRTDVYIVQAIDSVARTLTLNIPYVNTTISTPSAYAIHRDFTATHGIPVPNRGDVETATILGRAMALIDGKLTGATSFDDAGPSYTKASHGFRIGNIVYLDSGGVFLKATSATEDEVNRIAGMVSSVPDTNTFTLKTWGRVQNIAQTLVPGTVYYLRNAVTGGGDNLTVSTFTYKVQCLLALTASSGVLFNIPRASAAATGATAGVAGTSGLVPAPAAGEHLDFLRGDMTWQSGNTPDSSLLVQHLKEVGDTALSWPLADTNSILEALTDLNTRINKIKSALQTTVVWDYRSDGAESSLVIPANVDRVYYTVIGVGTMGAGNLMGRAGAQAYGSFAVTESQVVSGYVGKAGDTPSRNGQDTVLKLAGGEVMRVRSDGTVSAESAGIQLASSLRGLNAMPGQAGRQGSVATGGQISSAIPVGNGRIILLY